MEVEEGLKNGLDTEQIDIFAKSEYDHMQMQEIRLALEHGFTLKADKCIFRSVNKL